MLAITRLAHLASCLFLFCCLSYSAVLSASPSEALRRAELLVDEAKKQCDSKQASTDTLIKVVCSGEMDIGVRANYKLFGETINGERVGFELDLARKVAELMGVRPKFYTVSGADRIAILLEGKVDVVIATMGHTTTRETAVEFVKPHYYLSSTSIVGVRSIAVEGLSDLATLSVCVPLGSYANMLIADARARLMIYSRPDQMLDALRLGACRLIAHDDSLLTALVTGPFAPADLRENFNQKFAFSSLPWGMGVRPSDKDGLGKVLSYLLIYLHQTGFLVDAGERNGIGTDFLIEQRARWRDESCFSATGVIDSKCFLRPADLRETPTVIEPKVVRFQNWLLDSFSVKVALPMFTGQNSMALLIRGAQVTLVLVVLSIFATLAFSWLFYVLMTSRNSLVSIVSKVMGNLFANSPVILLLVLGYLTITTFIVYDMWVAGGISLIVVGANNGANGGFALREAAESLPRDTAFNAIAWTSSNQLRASVINAVKATPVAAFIGAPEMLSALNDIASFTGERLTTYSFVAVYYLVLVQIVIVLSAQFVKSGKEKK